MPRAESVVVSVAFKEGLFADPGDGTSFTIPLIGVVPFKNCTGAASKFPPGAPGASPLNCVEVTVAVSVTLPPDVIVVGLAVTAVVVAACVIITVSVGDVLGLKLLSPAYVATKGWEPVSSCTG